MNRRRCALLLVLLSFVIVTACQEKEDLKMTADTEQEPVAATPVVFGVVQQSPPRSMPPKQAAQPGPVVPGATVALLAFATKDEAAGEVVAETVTDSLGTFRLSAAPGKYFLVVQGASIPYAQYTTGYMGKNFSAVDSVQTYRIVELTEEKLEMKLTLPQAWPE